MSLDMDAEFNYYNELPGQAWNAVLDDFDDAIGMSYETFTAKISDAWELEKFYSLSTRGNSDSEYKLHDYAFEYQTENGGKVSIALCSYETPLRDWFIDDDTAELSSINDMQLVVYGYDNIFVAQFSYQNVNYDITTDGVTLEELENLLMNVLDN